MNYPTHLSVPPSQESFVIAQLSDLHLSYHHPEHLDKFLWVLELALRHEPSLLLLTGDLVNDGTTPLYDWLFAQLLDTRIPFLCLAGNHDLTQEIGHDLPFHHRQFLPAQRDTRLIDTHRLVIQLPNISWQLLAVNSAVHGQIHGMLDVRALDFLANHLQSDMPTLIAMHHHPSPIGSAWIDAYRLMNADAFWQTLQAHPTHHRPHVLSGHVHQAAILVQEHGTLYTCPATSRQFIAHQDTFGIDQVADGFRLLQLYNNATLDTWVKRLDNNKF